MTLQKNERLKAVPPWIVLDPVLTAEGRELKLYAENVGALYPQYCAICHNLNRKQAAGTFDLARAAVAFLPWVTAAAQRYVVECSTPGDKYYNLFPLSDRRAVASVLAAEYVAGYHSGEFDHLNK